MRDPKQAERLSGNRVIVLLNPTAGRERRESHAEFSRAVEDLGYDVGMVSSPTEFCTQAEEWRTSGDLRAVVAVGGDGTIELVANHVHPDVPIAVLPRGTENLLAKHFRLPSDPQSAARLVHDAGTVARIDAGQAGRPSVPDHV